MFGVSSDECLNYATENRRLWAEAGRQLVQDMTTTDPLARLRRTPHGHTRRSRQPALLAGHDAFE